jgi:eukaryotic-like serine/threonine-protein kinase
VSTRGDEPWPDPGSVRPGGPPDAIEAERWRRVRALFEEVVEHDPEAWPDLLAATPEVDRELLAGLLAGDRMSEPFLDHSPDRLAADLFTPDEPLPQRIGPYRVIRLLGRGGMGQVLLARPDDGSSEQDVALKVVRRGMDSEDVLRRFRAEQKILAILTHPNIARLLDGGITRDGRPYFVMECIHGSPITTHCETRGLSLESRLRLFVAACSAVEHAHARGIVHRDLKPRNIVVAEGEAPSEGSVKLLDFGIAKVLEPDCLDLTVAHTHTGSRLMTPEYASPEQIRSGPLGPASDVYSLGVVLYELLTGRRPHDLSGLALSEVEQVICETPPEKPTNGGRRLSAALQAVVLMALRKEPHRRYGSAGELGNDIRRFLAGESVRARSDPLPYRVRTYVRRRTVALALLMAAMGITVGVVGLVLHPGGEVPPAAAVQDPLAIAVLPFEYTGPEGQEYFADGLVDVVNVQLAGMPGLRVVSPGPSVHWEGPARSAGDMGAQLGVQYLLDGSVQFERPTDPSGRVVVVPRLIRIEDDSVVWSRTFDHTMVQFFAVQSVIAREVAGALEIDLTDMGRAAPGVTTTADLEAYRFYLRGNDFLRFNESEERLGLAEASYLAALERDSTFGEAWAKLSAVHTQLWFHRYDPSQERLEWAREAAERALHTSPDLPEAYYALGLFQYQGRGDLLQGQRYFEQALGLQPNHVRALFGLANVLRRQGRMEEALVRFEELALLDPLDANYLLSAAFTHQLLRNYMEAEGLLATVMERAPDLPMLYFIRAHLSLSQTGSVDDARSVLAQGMGAAVDNDQTRFLTASLDLMAGRYQEVLWTTAPRRMEVLDGQSVYMPVAWLRAAAYRGLGQADSARVQEGIALRLLEARVNHDPEDARAFGALGRVYATLGRPDEAIRAARRGKELLPLNRDAILAPFRMEDLAAVYVLNGQLDEAIAEVEALLAVPGMFSPRHLRADPLWAPLLTHPRFPADG